MDFQEAISSGWAHHADKPNEVLREAVALVEAAPADGAGALANLLFHVGGEHLGRFELVADAVGRLLAIVEGPASAATLHRVLAACALCIGAEEQARGYLLQAVGDPVVNSGMVLGLAASAMAAQGRVREAARHFDSAVELAESTEGLHRTMAVTGNNLAVSLEQKAQRAPEDDALMLRAAQVARVYWERAGTWVNVERAEYRLAATRLARGEAGLAVGHAQRVLSIVGGNGGNPGEEFFGWEVLARAHHAGGDHGRARDARDRAAECMPNIMDEGFRAYCASSLLSLDKCLGRA